MDLVRATRRPSEWRRGSCFPFSTWMFPSRNLYIRHDHEAIPWSLSKTTGRLLVTQSIIFERLRATQDSCRPPDANEDEATLASQID